MRLLREIFSPSNILCPPLSLFLLYYCRPFFFPSLCHLSRVYTPNCLLLELYYIWYAYRFEFLRRTQQAEVASKIHLNAIDYEITFSLYLLLFLLSLISFATLLLSYFAFVFLYLPSLHIFLFSSMDFITRYHLCFETRSRKVHADL